jgi:hypothetical protein
MPDGTTTATEEKAEKLIEHIHARREAINKSPAPIAL